MRPVRWEPGVAHLPPVNPSKIVCVPPNHTH
jgi:hypothetical protein